MSQPADVFISCSREDKDRVLGLAPQLRETERAIDALQRALREDPEFRRLLGDA